MNPLILHLKYKYYNMIKKGEKKVEYRVKKPYWDRRLKDRKEIIFVPGYVVDNSWDLKASIVGVDVVSFFNLPDYVKKEFANSSENEFYAIKFKLKS